LRLFAIKFDEFISVSCFTNIHIEN